jgi:hypothetical protein
LRALLLEALRGCAPATVDGLGALATWPALVALWDAGWLGGSRASEAATIARVRRRLRVIAAARVSVAAVSTVKAGAVVCVTGEVGELRAPDELLLADAAGDLALVALSDARWVGDRRTPHVSDGITVLGFADRSLDTAARSPDPRRPPRRAVVRAGDLPLVAALETRYTPR